MLEPEPIATYRPSHLIGNDDRYCGSDYLPSMILEVYAVAEADVGQFVVETLSKKVTRAAVMLDQVVLRHLIVALVDVVQSAQNLEIARLADLSSQFVVERSNVVAE